LGGAGEPGGSGTKGCVEVVEVGVRSGHMNGDAYATDALGVAGLAYFKVNDRAAEVPG